MNKNNKYNNELNLIIDEYKAAITRTNEYFGFLYKTINFYTVAVSSIFVFILKDASPYAFQLTTLFVIPIITYIFGLFYNYNGCMISKLGSYQLEIEIKLKILSYLNYENDIFEGWLVFIHKNKKEGFIYSYGTLLMFFLLIPIACFILCYNYNPIKPVTSIRGNNILLGLSIGFYIIFFIFMTKLIIISGKNLLSRRNLKVDLMINNVHVRSGLPSKVSRVKYRRNPLVLSDPDLELLKIHLK